jgi:uncharacterized protein YndB with AHSA1/START domain
MPYRFTVSDLIPARPRQVYDAWLDSRAHSRMTGGKARVSSRVGGTFTAWDGYITGTNLELTPGKRIVQAWRTSEFADSDPDSRITVTFKPVAGGTRVTLLHTRVPDNNTGYRSGWHESYFEPMKDYFGKAKRKESK